MKKIKNSLFLALVVLFSGCSIFKKSADKETRKVGETYTTSSGLQYTLKEIGEGPEADSGDIVEVHYTGFLIDSTKFDSSKDRNTPFSFKIGSGQVIEGWDEGVSYLRVGDKATFVLPADIAYGERATGEIPANSTLIFDIEVLSLKPGAKPFIVDGQDTTSYPSGLKIIKLIENPDSVLPAKGEMVKVDYSGYLLNGKMFDSSVDRGEPIEFPVGTGRVIKGWDEALLLLRKGEKARLIIPSDLAYGKSGAGKVIPPDATLIFDVELHGVN